MRFIVFRENIAKQLMTLSALHRFLSNQMLDLALGMTGIVCNHSCAEILSNSMTVSVTLLLLS